MILEKGEGRFTIMPVGFWRPGVIYFWNQSCSKRGRSLLCYIVLFRMFIWCLLLFSPTCSCKRVSQLQHIGGMWLRRYSRLAGYRKVASSILVSSSSVDVSLSETPHPDCSWRAVCRPAWLTPPSVCECVQESVKVGQYCKGLWVATG